MALFKSVEHINAIATKNHQEIIFYSEVDYMLRIILDAVEKQVELEANGDIEENRFIMISLLGCTKDHKYAVSNYLSDLGYSFSVHSEDDKEIEAIDFLWKEWEDSKDEMSKKMLDNYIESNEDFILSWATEEFLDFRLEKDGDDE